jgi:hypothetical protein
MVNDVMTEFDLYVRIYVLYSPPKYFKKANDSVKADSHIACRAAKGLECVFPI